MTALTPDPAAPEPNHSAAPASRDCELCTQVGGDLLWRDKRCRVVLVRDPDYAGYCRVIWDAHVREMTDLDDAERAHCMRVVFAAEQALRSVFNPHKINLASFGNLTPHMHWHVIPRRVDDAHFPNPVWGERRRDTPLSGATYAVADARHRLAAEFLKLL